MEIISLGFTNYIPCHRISMILQIESRPAKRLISRAREIDKLIDASSGRKTRSVVVTSDGYVVLSAIASSTLADRVLNRDKQLEVDEDDYEDLNP